MSLIVLEHGCLSFGSQRILADANLRIAAQERIGLVGPNGAGKSTLFKVLMGTLPLDSGNLQHCRSLAIGHLPQDVQELAGGTVLGSVLETVPGRGAIRARLEQAEATLTTSSDPEEQLRSAELLGELADELEHFETFFSEQRARTILLGLGFRTDDLGRSLTELSGGWKMRCALAGLLFQQPDVLFLDEPTNHLDLPSVLWLDRFLDQLRSAVVLISHDRAFLDRHVDRVLSFEPEGLRNYPGNFTAYLAQRELEEEVRNRSLENRERVIEQAERFVERFRAKATKARQAQARARRAKRMMAELEADRPPVRRRSLTFHFPPIPRTGRDVLLLEGVRKAFGELVLFDGLTRGVYQGDRIVIVGRNGAGKTTLLRLLAGDLTPDRGTVRRGAGVRIGYYAQHMCDQLDFRRTVVEEVRACSPLASETFVRGVCGAFLFSGEDVDKVIGILSGGERARVQLARLLVDPGQVLLMDEPTNHLDVQAADALATALSGYGGTLVFVSHDLGFVNRLATKVWDLEGGELLEYPGRMDEYLAHRERREQERSGSSAREAVVAFPRRGPTQGRALPDRTPDGRPRVPPTRTPLAPPSGTSAPRPAGQPRPASKAEQRPQPTTATSRPEAAGTAAAQPKKFKKSRKLRQQPRPAEQALPPPAQVQGSATAAHPAPGRRTTLPNEPEVRPVRPSVAPAHQAPPGRGSRRAAEQPRVQARIETLEAQLRALESQLADPEIYKDPARFEPLLRQFQEGSAKVTELRARLPQATPTPDHSSERPMARK